MNTNGSPATGASRRQRVPREGEHEQSRAWLGHPRRLVERPSELRGGTREIPDAVRDHQVEAAVPRRDASPSARGPREVGRRVVPHARDVGGGAEHGPRQVGADHVPAEARERERVAPGAAADVEHARATGALQLLLGERHQHGVRRRPSRIPPRCRERSTASRRAGPRSKHSTRAMIVNDDGRQATVHVQYAAVRWSWEECVANPSEMPGATPVAPLTLAAYQDGAVVSRILLKRGGGTVTLFAFDEGQSLSEHTAPFDAVAHVLEGEAAHHHRGRAAHGASGRDGADAGESAARGRGAARGSRCC